MGFRTTMISEGMAGVEVPQWFLDKWDWIKAGSYKHNSVWIDKNVFPIYSLCEVKFYQDVDKQEVFLDIQKIIINSKVDDVTIVLLHECGGITRVKITPYKITAREPIAWKDVEKVEHDHCYGCSDKQYI